MAGCGLDSASVTERRLGGGDSRIVARTNRIGLASIHASAPVLAGVVSGSRLEFTVGIAEVVTGNPLLDPELHALIHRITDGTLVFTGHGDGEFFAGRASAGTITVPLSLRATPAGADLLHVTGSSTFSDVRTPLPGLGHIPHLEVDIEGRLHLV